ncbi:MAG: hypothetical protein Q8M07_20600, partial [Prosthecobacter sp.]|nr:hypothetical protein [Prosthecobacter sp.]
MPVETSPSPVAASKPFLLKVLCSLGVMLLQWVNSDYHPEGAEAVMQKEEKVDMKRTMPFIILHACCLLVFVVGFSWFAVAAAAA